MAALVPPSPAPASAEPRRLGPRDSVLREPGLRDPGAGTPGAAFPAPSGQIPTAPRDDRGAVGFDDKAGRAAAQTPPASTPSSPGEGFAGAFRLAAAAYEFTRRFLAGGFIAQMVAQQAPAAEIAVPSPANGTEAYRAVQTRGESRLDASAEVITEFPRLGSGHVIDLSI